VIHKDARELAHVTVSEPPTAAPEGFVNKGFGPPFALQSDVAVFTSLFELPFLTSFPGCCTCKCL
jgi:hypothetical protein